MMTSYFGGVKKLPADVVPVSIARFNRFWTGRKLLALAPTPDMLKINQADYNAAFAKILAKLDPQAIAAELGDNAVLLCFEKPGEICHRRAVAEWLERTLGIEVTEFGFARQDCPAYADLIPSPPKPEKPPKAKKGGSSQLLMF
jgi:hypothetical protein